MERKVSGRTIVPLYDDSEALAALLAGLHEPFNVRARDLGAID